jgi:hypothetical protein
LKELQVAMLCANRIQCCILRAGNICNVIAENTADDLGHSTHKPALLAFLLHLHHTLI